MESFSSLFMNVLFRIRNTLAGFGLRLVGRLLARRNVHQGAAWCLAEAQRLAPDAGDDGLFELARMRWLAQDYGESRRLLEQLLESQAEHVKALNLLGVIEYLEDRYSEAARLSRLAISLSPAWAAPHNNLGNVLLAQNDFVGAEQCFRQALACDGEYAEAWCNLALLLNRASQYDEAEQAARSAIRYKPGFAGAFNNLGSILINLGRFAEGVAQYRKAAELQPDLIEAQVNLAAVVEEPGRLVAAMAHFRRVLEHTPTAYSALLRMAQGYIALGEFDQAEAYVLKLLEINADAWDVHALLAAIAAGQGINHRLLDANLQAQNLGAGQGVCMAYVFHSLYDDASDNERIYTLARAWDQRFTARLRHASADVVSFRNATDSVRPLKVGYVSKDFKLHSVAFFLEPIMANHDRENFRIYCYASLFHTDEVTERYKGLAHVWRDIALVNDDDVAQLIRADEIDILVDLSGFTTGERLSVFARKPAPVQVSYLGYPATTGMSAIDYRLVDEITDPVGAADHFYSEKLWRLPHCFLTYQPLAVAPEVESPPCLSKGYVTFGSFNTALKVTERVVEIWSRILNAVPDSRLMLKSSTFSSEKGKAYFQSLFARQGLGGDRVELFSWHPDPAGHLGLYSKVDIALDPFPYNGTTTTCEALWMGVPVLTLAGNRHSARVGTSLLSQAGLSELVADSAEDYVQRAVALAGDQDRLVSLRGSLRQCMRNSPLLDHAGFTRRLEQAYREMWGIAAQQIEAARANTGCAQIS